MQISDANDQYGIIRLKMSDLDYISSTFFYFNSQFLLAYNYINRMTLKVIHTMPFRDAVPWCKSMTRVCGTRPSLSVQPVSASKQTRATGMAYYIPTIF